MNNQTVPKVRLFFSLPLFAAICAFSCSGISGVVPEEPAVSTEAALQAYYDGRVEDSAAAFEAILAVREHDRQAKRQLVRIYRELGNYDRAEQLLEELAGGPAEDPETRKIRQDLFITSYLNENYRKAASFRVEAEAAAGFKDERSLAELYFYEAMLSLEGGNRDEAETLFRKSLDLDRFRPIAWYQLGLLTRDSREAENYLQTCVNQDSAFSDAFYPLGKLYLSRKAWKQAADFLGRASLRFPEDRDIASALAQAKRNTPLQDDASLIHHRISANPPRLQAPVSDEGSIRIGLAERRVLLTAKAGGDFTLRALDNTGPGQVVYRGKAREQLWFNWKSGTAGPAISVQDQNGREYVQSAKTLVLEYGDPANTSIMAGIVTGAPGASRTYRGTLEFRPAAGGITAVNIVGVEEYLYSVIPSEMPASWPGEALKAQAIAARSYSVANLGQFSSRGFDLYGTPLSMAYLGVGAEHKLTTAAVDATRGIILKGGDKPLNAYFSANHGGYSDDSQTLWGGYDSYMQAVPDKLLPERKTLLPLDELDDWIREAPPSYSSVSRLHSVSAYRWEKWVSPGEIRRRLLARQAADGVPQIIDPGEIRQIISRGRGISGRIYELEVTGTQGTLRVRGDAIWTQMGGLRSSLFTIDSKRNKDGGVEYFIFKGAGYGHGIGLDQSGAAGMANAGYNAMDILFHYYPRAELGRL